MKIKIVYLILLFLPLAGIAQNSDSIHLFLNKTLIATAASSEATEATLARAKTGTVKLKLPANEDFKTSVLVMNEARNTLITKHLTRKCNSVSFTIAELLNKTKGESFSFYLLTIPIDPATAASMRIMPVLFCNVNWK